jgi:hypothetical protein
LAQDDRFLTFRDFRGTADGGTMAAQLQILQLEPAAVDQPP